MEKLNIDLLLRALDDRKKILLSLREEYEHELVICCSEYGYKTELSKDLQECIDSITDELFEIVEQEEVLENLK